MQVAPRQIIHLTLALQERSTNLERVNLEAKRAQRVLYPLLQLCDLRLHTARYTLSLLGNGVSRITGTVKFQGSLDFISQELWEQQQYIVDLARCILGT